MVSVIETTSI
ncbi:hypothetical protein VTL71DRAFT_10328 [Oculimacula yallundae]|uniref:Uncharacterized protein n=1 Tax=Oculimacula yallundae TaxID=86028 RepID=A0ABR4CSY8_9HELO